MNSTLADTFDLNLGPVSIVSTALIVFALGIFFAPFKNKRGVLPPGPPSIPWVGNYHELPYRGAHYKYTEWAKKYGDIYYFHMFGNPVMVLNDFQSNYDILEERRELYSDRPQTSIMCTKLIGWENAMGLRRSDERFNNIKKLMNTSLSPAQIRNIHPTQEYYAMRLLTRLANTPEDFMDHLRYAIEDSLLMIVFGKAEVPEFPYFEMSYEANQGFATSAVPFNHIVDIFPFLQHLPSWMPGAGFKRKAAIWRKNLFDFVEIPYKIVKAEVQKGTNRISHLSNFLQLQEAEFAQDESIAAWTAMTLNAASVDTLALSLQSFVLAMLAFPEVQKKAQAEIDAATDGERFPTTINEVGLPYTQAVLYELLRWAPVTPLGLQHVNPTEDSYGKFRIPKKTTIVSNVWAMTRREDVYPDPETFRPERYLPDANGKTEMDPKKFVFGFGKRSCPGQHLAEMTLYLYMVHILAVFTIEKKVDAQGRIIEPTIAFDGTMLLRPEPFKCKLVVRNPGLLEHAKEHIALGIPDRLE